MVRLCCFAALCICFTSHALCQQDTIVLSPRVGTLIDTEEREYFGLFPDVDGFVSAAAIRDVSSIRIDVQYGLSETPSVQHFELAEKDLELLEAWFKDFEPIRYAMHSPTDFEYARMQYRTLVTKGIILPYKRPTPLHVSVSMSDGRVIEGMLLCSDNTQLILDPDPERYSFTDAVFVDTDSILDLAYEEKTSLGLIPVMAGITLGGLSALLVAHNYPMTSPCDNCMGIQETQRFMLSAATFVLVSAASAVLTYVIGNVTRPGKQYASIDKTSQKPVIPEILFEHQFFNRGVPPELKQRLNGNQ